MGGFCDSLRKYALPRVVEALEALDVEVYEPFQRNVQAGLIRKDDADWAWRVAQADAEAVRSCDALFAVITGVPPDEGVCVELGIAIALGKPTFLFRDDCRPAESEGIPCNLMLMAGLPRDPRERRRYFYSSLDQIGDPAMALWDWARGSPATDCT